MAGVFVQGAQNFNLGAGPFPLIQQQFNSPQSDGNLNVVFAYSSTSNSAIQVFDTSGNLYVNAVNNFQFGSAFISAFFCAGIQPGAENQVTAVFSTAAAFPRLTIGEWSGVALGPIDISGTGTGTSTAPTVSATTTNATDLLVAWFGGPSAVFTGAGAGYTSRISLDGNFTVVEDQNVAASGAQTATVATLSASETWGMVLLAFKQAGAIQPTVPVDMISSSFGVHRIGRS